MCASGLPTRLLAADEPGEVGYGLQVPHYGAWFHTRFMTHVAGLFYPSILPSTPPADTLIARAAPRGIRRSRARAVRNACRRLGK
jgi:hypothetical protein